MASRRHQRQNNNRNHPYRPATTRLRLRGVNPVPIRNPRQNRQITVRERDEIPEQLAAQEHGNEPPETDDQAQGQIGGQAEGQKDISSEPIFNHPESTFEQSQAPQCLPPQPTRSGAVISSCTATVLPSLASRQGHRKRSEDVPSYEAVQNQHRHQSIPATQLQVERPLEPRERVDLEPPAYSRTTDYTQPPSSYLGTVPEHNNAASGAQYASQALVGRVNWSQPFLENSWQRVNAYSSPFVHPNRGVFQNQAPSAFTAHQRPMLTVERDPATQFAYHGTYGPQPQGHHHVPGSHVPLPHPQQRMHQQCAPVQQWQPPRHIVQPYSSRTPHPSTTPAYLAPTVRYQPAFAQTPPTSYRQQWNQGPQRTLASQRPAGVLVTTNRAPQMAPFSGYGANRPAYTAVPTYGAPPQPSLGGGLQPSTQQIRACGVGRQAHGRAEQREPLWIGENGEPYYEADVGCSNEPRSGPK